jgi:hypothetical protein
VGGAQDDARRLAGLEGFVPARGAQAPAVAGLEAGEAAVVMTQTVWLPTSSGPVLQQPSR